MKFSIHQASHIGNRKYNQDRAAYAYSSEALLMVLADGMGGHLHGELAAELIIATFTETFGKEAQPRIADPARFVADTMRRANERIMQVVHDASLGGMPGSTCVAALIQDDRVCWGHAGDSRLYLLRNGTVFARTRDHSMVQQWFDWGMISAEEARAHPQRNQITNCLGGVEDMFYMEAGPSIPLQTGDVLLLGSDGLWGPFTDSELAGVFDTRPIGEALEGLVAGALERERGRSDNVTGLALRWGEGETVPGNTEPVCHILEV
jgi:serine/threonine protein phosphatase PrpC